MRTKIFSVCHLNIFREHDIYHIQMLIVFMWRLGCTGMSFLFLTPFSPLFAVFFYFSHLLSHVTPLSPVLSHPTQSMKLTADTKKLPLQTQWNLIWHWKCSSSCNQLLKHYLPAFPTCKQVAKIFFLPLKRKSSAEPEILFYATIRVWNLLN